MEEGWIGAWSPGIGDPTATGWITVLLYASAAWACLRVATRSRVLRLALSDEERTLWRVLLTGLIFLGFNKQLDLQSGLTELARTMAHAQGWYEQRHQYQEAFVAAAPIAVATALAALVVLVHNAPKATWLTCAGTAGLMVFVAVRATSFHPIDDALGWRAAGLTLNGMLEMGALLTIMGGAFVRGQGES